MRAGEAKLRERFGEICFSTPKVGEETFRSPLLSHLPLLPHPFSALKDRYVLPKCYQFAHIIYYLNGFL